jgi:NhaP-type Na+/H+ or K+/H+ antiporter
MTSRDFLIVSIGYAIGLLFGWAARWMTERGKRSR